MGALTWRNGAFLSNPRNRYLYTSDDNESRDFARAALESGAAKAWREEAGYSQIEAASVVGVSDKTLSSWERRTRAPTGAHEERYGRFLLSLLPGGSRSVIPGEVETRRTA